jgi:hypothetical protein
MTHTNPTNEKDPRGEIDRLLGSASTAGGRSLDFDSAFALVYAAALPFRTVVEARVQHDIEDRVGDPPGPLSRRGRKARTDDHLGVLGLRTAPSMTFPARVTEGRQHLAESP